LVESQEHPVRVQDATTTQTMPNSLLQSATGSVWFLWLLVPGQQLFCLFSPCSTVAALLLIPPPHGDEAAAGNGDDDRMLLMLLMPAVAAAAAAAGGADGT
jgi:hypothetical protein